MPGNFDCPEASNSTSSSMPARRDSIHRNFNPYPPSPPPPYMERGFSTRATFGGLRQSAPEGRSSLRQSETVADRSSSHTPRDRNTSTDPNERNTSYLQRHRLRRQREEDSTGTVQDAVDRLNEITTDLTSLLDQPLPQIVTSDDVTFVNHTDDYYVRRHKRRKLDSDPLNVEPPPVYGHYGQVVPGRLKMSMLSCDGGYLTERGDETIHSNYWPENVLRNDKSVYCTERHRCNILLSHANETQFSVSKIVIKAPDSGFTAPVQEGLLFIAMKSEGLLSRTERYRVRSSPPPRLTASSSVYPESHGQHARIPRPTYGPPRPGWTSHAYSTARPPSRRHNFPAAHVISPPIAYDPALHQYPPRTEDRPPPLPASRDSSDISQEIAGALPSDIPLSSGYNVTTTCDDPSGDEEDPSSAAVIHDRQQRRRNFGFDYFSSDDEDMYRRRRRLRCSPRKIELEGSDEAGQHNNGTDVLVPHARFFIENKKSVVSVKFDPPIAGKYVLLKLWSPHGERDNIDIQSISVYGYAGTRFVPAIKLK